MTVQLGADVAVLLIVCSPIAAFMLGVLFAWLILENHYHR